MSNIITNGKRVPTMLGPRQLRLRTIEHFHDI